MDPSSSSSTYLNLYKQEEDEETEDTLSLSDFPLNSNQESEKHTQLYRRSSSEPSDFFEFFTSHQTHLMSHAEDIILCGKLIPFQNIVNQNTDFGYSPTYSESLPDLNNPIPSSTRTRSTRSLDSETVKRRHRNVRVVKRDVSEFHEKFGKNNSNKFDHHVKASKPRWYVLVFGQVKFPAEMELKDIKSRQVRRCVGGGGGCPAQRIGGWGQDWLRVLSCKRDDNVSVVPPTSLRGTVS